MRVGDTRMSSLPFSYGSIGGYIAECLAGVRNEDVLCSDRRADKMAVVDRSMDGLLTGKSRDLVANCCLPKHLTQGIINTTTGLRSNYISSGSSFTPTNQFSLARGAIYFREYKQSVVSRCLLRLVYGIGIDQQ